MNKKCILLHFSFDFASYSVVLHNLGLNYHYKLGIIVKGNEQAFQ